jgi:hypothetical protein
MAALTPMERLHRFAALSIELYCYSGLPPSAAADCVTRGLTRDMRVSSRTVRRWRDLETPVPKPVLVALGAMLAVKRAERAGIPV